MTLHHPVIGCDISKSHLDLYDAERASAERIPNTSEAIQHWLTAMGHRQPFFVFEATGGYDARLARSLQATGIRFARVNPARARNFARASGVLAKTDKVDAAMLAEMGVRLALDPTPPACPQKQKLFTLSRRRDQLVATRKQELTRLKLIDDEEVAADIQQHVEQLTERIKTIERRCLQTVKASKTAADYDLLRSIPGVGNVTAIVLIAALPELGSLSRRAIALLAGLAPINNDSGFKRGKRSIKGGRRRLTHGLYMCALTAVRSSSRFSTFYNRLINNGLAKKAALIAVARKLIVTANAMIRDQKAYRE